ncbi:MAG TPA: hypothetical protein VGO26_11910 [Amnibacterium sp.]|jgi:hypothetical protein|nr:hypothetical protein [Amnibacterium sp.]
MFHFGRPGSRSTAEAVLPADLPRPGVQDPVRAFAYDAVRAATNALWVTIPGALVDAVDPLLTAMPDLRHPGVRWTGAGVLPSARAQWWALDGAESGTSVLLVTGDALETERVALALRRTFTREAVHETSASRPVPGPVLQAAAAARALPVWEVAGFARLAPRALLDTGFATIAA